MKKTKKDNNTPKVSEHKNGKGDSPRNISSKFKKNYEQINCKKKK